MTVLTRLTALSEVELGSLYASLSTNTKAGESNGTVARKARCGATLNLRGSLKIVIEAETPSPKNVQINEKRFAAL